MADEKKVLDYNGLLHYHQGLKNLFLTDVSYDTTNSKFTKSKNGQTTDVITIAALKTALSLDNVGNFKAVSTVANQGLTDAEKAAARSNIGAGSSGFSGDFEDLTNVPTTISGYGITDASIANDLITIGSNTFKGVSVAANQGLTSTEKENARANLGITLTEIYKFKGSVATVSALDSIQTKEIGDVYNVVANGKNYAWTGTDWDDLGGEFSITSITNTEIDTILAT